MIRRPPRSTLDRSSAASDVYKRQARSCSGCTRGRRRATVPPLSLPIIPELQRIIDASVAAGITGELSFLVTEYGKPFSIAGFGNKFRQWCDEAGLYGLSAHG